MMFPQTGVWRGACFGATTIYKPTNPNSNANPTTKHHAILNLKLH